MQSKHIVIIGGTSGSGRVLVRRLSENQARVSLLGRHPSPEVQQHLPGVHFYPVDLQNISTVLEVINKVVADNGKITHLIFFQRFREKENNWEGELQISLTATKEIIEAGTEVFDGSGENSIVVVSSIVVILFIPNNRSVTMSQNQGSTRWCVIMQSYSGQEESGSIVFRRR